MNAFQGFVARKTAEAEAHALEPFRTAVDRGAGLIAIGNAWSRSKFDGAFYMSAAPHPAVPAASLVFVRSREGNTVAADPSTLGGGETDKHLVYEGLSRVAADAVLGGAGTIRGGNLVLSVWRPELVDLRSSLGLPRHPVQVVATLGGLDLTAGLMFNTDALRVIVITTPVGGKTMRSALAARPWISLVTVERAGDLASAFRQLRAHGIARVSCIGGRTLAGTLIGAGLVQDLYLTTSPKSAGEPDTPFSSKPLDGQIVVRKHGTSADEGVIFEHLVLHTTPVAG